MFFRPRCGLNDLHRGSLTPGSHLGLPSFARVAGWAMFICERLPHAHAWGYRLSPASRAGRLRLCRK